jgi:transcription-repair coupling factor (superfamily II helicase)
VQNLFAVAAFRVKARQAGLTEIALQGKNVRFAPMPLPESKVMRLTRLYPGAMYKQTVGTVAIPAPTTARIGGRPLRDTELLDWASGVIDALAPDPATVSS